MCPTTAASATTNNGNKNCRRQKRTAAKGAERKSIDFGRYTQIHAQPNTHTHTYRSAEARKLPHRHRQGSAHKLAKASFLMPPPGDFWLCTLCIRHVAQPGRVIVDESYVGEGRERQWRNSGGHKNGESNRARWRERRRA